MKKYFKKVSAILSTGVITMSSIALAAAASYPAPFVVGGSANVAVVYGANSASTDVVHAGNIQSNLQSHMGSSDGSTDGISGTGEFVELSNTGDPLLLNATLSSVKSTLSSSDLATVLKDGTFQSTSSIGYTQRIYPGANQIDFAKQPSDDDDAQIGIALGTAPKTNYLYNVSVTFDENVNFTHADSAGETLTILGNKLTVGAGTTATKLVLLRSAESVDLDSDSPTADVTVEGETYTIELVSASDDAATVKVTDSSGKSARDTVNENDERTVNGLSVAVTNADETNLKLSATVTIGSSKLTLQDGIAVKEGSGEDIIDGTNVEFYDTAGAAATPAGGIGEIVLQVSAKNGQTDAIVPEQEFIDPIFGTIKVDFAGITVPMDSTAREEILVANSGSDKMTVNLRSHDGTDAKTVTWVKNNSAAMALADEDRDLFVVSEMGAVNQSGYVVLANDKEGGLYEVTSIINSSSTTASDDSITLRNVFTGLSYTFKATTEGTVSVSSQQGKTYTISYVGADSLSGGKAMTLRVNYPESTNDMILFPTIKTSKGAKVAFYQPTTINIGAWDGANSLDGDNFLLPDGDGYEDVAVTDANGVGNFTIDGTDVNSTSADKTVTVGQLTYNFTYSTLNTTIVYLNNPEGGYVTRPALIVFEEKDEASAHQAFVVTLDAGYDGDSAGIGVSDVVRTWGADTDLGNEIQLESDSDLYQDMDIWGTLFELDKSDSDQTTARISYPDTQVQAQVVVAEESAMISGGTVSGTTSTPLGEVLVTDAEISSVQSKNLILVGGSCVNSATATALGVSYPTCGAAFTTATGVGSGQFLIKSVADAYTTGKIALVVAGYDAADTANAATYLRTQAVDTSKEYKGTSSTSAELVTTVAA